jgi:putative component of membrane protein insertase Oxa1/YidC/SpoIIIJ protein YidD
MSRAVVAGMIVLYQRHVSPRKGFGCPMRVLRGRNSCSEFARRAVGRVGAVGLLPLLRRRFARCAAVRRAAAAGPPAPPGEPPAPSPRPLDYEAPEPKRRKRGRWWRDGNGGRFCTPCDIGDLVCCVDDFACSVCDGPGGC